MGGIGGGGMLTNNRFEDRRDPRARNARDRLASALDLHPRDLRVISAEEAEAMEESIQKERQRRS